MVRFWKTHPQLWDYSSPDRSHPLPVSRTVPTVGSLMRPLSYSGSFRSWGCEDMTNSKSWSRSFLSQNSRTWKLKQKITHSFGSWQVSKNGWIWITFADAASNHGNTLFIGLVSLQTCCVSWGRKKRNLEPFDGLAQNLTNQMVQIVKTPVKFNMDTPKLAYVKGKNHRFQCVKFSKVCFWYQLS